MKNFVTQEPSTKGLIAQYKLGFGPTEISAPVTVFDYSLNGLIGTLTGTDILVAYPGFSFNGTDDVIEIGTGPTAVKTVSIWVNLADVAGLEGIVELTINDYLAINAGVVVVVGFTAADLYVDGVLGTSGVTTVDTNWHHIAITDTTPVNANTFNIGEVNTVFGEGKIGETMLYDRVLPAAEIKSVYSLQRHRYSA